MSAVLHTIATGTFWLVVTVVGAAWIVSAAAVAGLLGRVIRRRDRQIPRDHR
jgi:predicted branched-subunit amino acid permease